MLAEYVTCLESVFREQVPPAIQGTRIGLNFMSNMWDVSSARHVTCSKHSCLPADSHNIMMQLYFIVGVHHYLHEQNRQMQQPHATKNKENMTSEEDLAASTNDHCATKQHSLQERKEIRRESRKASQTIEKQNCKICELKYEVQKVKVGMTNW